MSSSEPIIGIDLGTTNSVVAIIEGGAPIIIECDGQPKTPSVVAFLENDELAIGEIGRRQSATQPHRTITSIKRLLGRFKHELDEEGERHPFEVGEDEHGRATVVIDGKSYRPEQVSALILKKLKAAAEEHLDADVTKAIITVPAYFDDVQRHATLEAAEIAGLEVLRLINEPTAAAMAYGLDKEEQETVAIYDFGGGTFDFSVLDIDNKTFEVLASTGNSRLGGDDLDMALVDHVAEKFLEEQGIDLREDYVTLRRLKDEMERIKCELSSSNTSRISLPFIAYQNGTPLHLEETLTRETLEEIIEPYVDETLRCCTAALKDAGVRKSQISKVILVGGSTRIPLVQDTVEDFFNVTPFRGVNPDEVVAIGAAVQGAVMAGHLEEVVLLDITPHTLGIEIKDDRRSVLIDKNSTIPIKVAKTFTTTEDNQTFVNVHLLQGEEESASANRSLGKFTLSGMPEGPAGVSRIRVEIFVNADGVVELSATESHSGQEKTLTASFSYLNADERRARQGLSDQRVKRRRRRRSKTASGALARKHLDPDATPLPISNIDPVETPQKPIPPAAPGEETATQPGEAANGSPSGTDSIPAPVIPVLPDSVSDTSVRETAIRPLTATGSGIVESVADTSPDLTPRPQTLAAAETDPGSPATAVRAKALDTLARSAEISASATRVIELLNGDRNDPDALSVYEERRKDFLSYCRERDDDASIQTSKVKFLIYLKESEEALEALVALGRLVPESIAERYELSGLLCRTFPNYVAARRERANLALEAGDLAIAMSDLEFVVKRDESDTLAVDDLTKVYEKLLNENPSATVQFKMVKMHLRRGETERAISSLQQLVQNPAHCDRANKVLGLCFWQKGLRYLALQKFKALATDEELKDILYRLAIEMEENDELLHAKYALERIYESEIGYRDTAERLKKLTYRIDLMQDDRYGAVASARPENRTPFGESGYLIGDRFEISHEINRGSMGIVYKALDRTLDEVVALKVLNDYLCTDPEAVERFKHEARSARKLTHAHIVRIHDFLNVDGKKIISMEYIEGENMKTILAHNRTFTQDMVMNYLRQICDALAYAHKFGIVHRDIKPANIMIDQRNQIKITDFGIAKLLNSSTATTGTMIVGTPLYMAPEQIQGRSVDQRADIYSFGIMLYELITGTPPFHEGRIEYQHVNEPVPEIKFGATDELKKLIYKCVEKDADKRYQSIEELVADLDD